MRKTKRLAGTGAVATVALGLLVAPAGAGTRPLTKADCKDGGWEQLHAYENQGGCVSASNHEATVFVPDVDLGGLLGNHNETVLSLG